MNTGYSALVRCTIAFACLLFFTTAPATAQEPLTLGVHPYLSAADLIKRFTPLAEYLSKEVHRPVSIEVSNTYDTHIQKIGHGVLDMAFMGPASYVILTDRFGKRPILAAFETKEGKLFHGHIMVRKDSPITSLRQLKGKRFVFGDRDSTMSHFVPRWMLLKSGIDVKDFSNVTFVANHDNIALGILAGTFDAGAVKEEVFLKYEPQGLRSLARSPAVADHIFVAREGLPKALAQSLRQALLRLAKSDEGRMILAGIRNDVINLVPGDDHDFDPLRIILKDLRKGGIEP